MATFRGYARAELLRAIDNIEMSLTHLERLIEPYSQAHPDISDAIQKCGDGLVLIADTIKKIHDSI